MADENAPFSLVTQSLAPDAVLCRIGGRIDGRAFETLEGEFGKLRSAGIKGVVLEAAGLEDVTSAALGAIVNMSRELEARGGALVLTLLRPGVEGLLELLGIKESLTIADSPESARKKVCGKQQ